MRRPFPGKASGRQVPAGQADARKKRGHLAAPRLKFRAWGQTAWGPGSWRSIEKTRPMGLRFHESFVQSPNFTLTNIVWPGFSKTCIIEPLRVLARSMSEKASSAQAAIIDTTPHR